MPLIGFITALPPARLTCRSGVAPISVRPPRCTTKVQYADGSPSSSRRKNASAVAGLQSSTVVT